MKETFSGIHSYIQNYDHYTQYSLIAAMSGIEIIVETVIEELTNDCQTTGLRK